MIEPNGIPWREERRRDAQSRAVKDGHLGALEQIEHILYMEELHGLPLRTAAEHARLELVFKPFPPIGKPGLRVPSLPWSGTIIGDNFYGAGGEGRKKKSLVVGDPAFTGY